MRLIFIVCTLFAAMLIGSSALSRPPGCSAETIENFQVFDERGRVIWDAPDMDCVEFFNFTFSTPEGTRTVRAVGDVNADTFLPSRGLAAVEQAARDATTKMDDLGDYKVPDITILVTDSLPDDADLVELEDGTSWRHSRTAADANPGSIDSDGECPVRLFSVGPMGAADIKSALAHELFHCVQFGSLSPAQISGAAPWWIEGSAEMFSNYVYPHGSSYFNREHDFHEDVVAQMPLYRMDYTSVFIFLYHHQQNGIAQLLPTLRTMPSSPDDATQRGAMRGMFSTSQWLEFAEAFEDGTIEYPDGRTINFGAPIPGETWTISRTSTHNRTLKSFVITPGWANYECGVWGNSLAPRDPNVALKVDGESSWNSWPAETDCRERRSIHYRTMAIHTGDANATLTLNAERRIACENCLGADSVIDRCLIGTWTQTGGGPTEWMRRNGVPITRDNVGGLQMTFADDGTFTSQPVGIDIQMSYPAGRDGPTVADSLGSIRGVGGRWSASRGQLTTCVDSGGQARGDTQWTFPGMSGTTGFRFNAGTGGVSSYTCSGNSLRTTIRMSQGGDMVHEFTRVTEPARR